MSGGGGAQPARLPPARPPGVGPSVPSRRAPSRLVAGMSSTQFNKGPSYGLSAEVKNRVSEGRPSPAPALPPPSEASRPRTSAGLRAPPGSPKSGGAVALGPGPRMALLPSI